MYTYMYIHCTYFMCNTMYKAALCVCVCVCVCFILYYAHVFVHYAHVFVHYVHVHTCIIVYVTVPILRHTYHTMASLGIANMMDGSIISIMSWSMYSFFKALRKGITHIL